MSDIVDETERLRKRCMDLAVVIGQITKQRDGLLAGLSKKDAEIERLRQVLGNVVDDLDDAGLIIQAERVREALGDE